MENRFDIVNAKICEFKNLDNNVIIRNNIEEDRLCVIDIKYNIAVDIETNYIYDYMKLINNKYFLNKDINELKEDKKYAIYSSKPHKINKKLVWKIENIIEILKIDDYENESISDEEATNIMLSCGNVIESKKDINCKIKKIMKKKRSMM